MRWVIRLVWLFPVVWLIAATMSFDGSNTVTVYSLRNIGDNGDGRPTQIDFSPTIFAVRNDVVVRSGGSFISKYDQCAILNVENWTCEYSDGSGSFGFKNGDYWHFPHSEDTKYVSRFNYVLNKCQWFIFEGDIISLLLCLFVPFGV